MIFKVLKNRQHSSPKKYTHLSSKHAQPLKQGVMPGEVGQALTNLCLPQGHSMKVTSIRKVVTRKVTVRRSGN